MRPRTVKEFAFFPIHDVAFEGETAVSFFPRAPELRLFAKSEDVIADDILAPVVLMKAAVLGAVNNVVLKQDLAAAFVGIESPTAVRKARHVVTQVIPLHRAGLDAQ